MLTKEQLKILGVFHKNIFAELTFKQIKNQSSQKSNNIVQIALKEFQKESIIKAKKIGDVFVYSLNLDNDLTLAYLNLVNQTNILNKKFPSAILAQIKNGIIKQTEFFVLMLFGSYAKGKANDKSDLDIAVIVESEQTKKDITPSLETIKRREIKPVDYHIFTKNEFLQMLNEEMENVGKQIYKNGITYYGFIEYCNMLRGTQK